MSDDIVTRLRLYANASIDGGWASVFRADLNIAADEIARLRNDLDGSQLAYRGASYDRDRMRAERDEARREVCEWVSLSLKRTPREVDKKRGWDCFVYEQSSSGDECQMEAL